MQRDAGLEKSAQIAHCAGGLSAHHACFLQSCNGELESLTPAMQIHRELVQSQAGISEALHQKFLAMLLAMEDVPAVLIVLADHLHLMRTAPTKEAAQDALDVFAPLANRLGVWSIKAELEDLSFKVCIIIVSCCRVCSAEDHC